ncbi:hypothetical protein [Xylocopilactobacillus apicola]|uniref:ESAT-6 secretion machinery protein EssA n=1 Tax=Xylocopilactobacillus apicola TaxID=2932184 RepID=A0AAU9DEX2_9LACO|nr:hypothetical protein [Xylocopilactobacillus apicola]BDR59447.1 hypothetical protein XA3_18880 [Xylocopilactobacillus apicola]
MKKKLFLKIFIINFVILLKGPAYLVLADDQSTNDGKMKINNIIENNKPGNSDEIKSDKGGSEITSSDGIFTEDSIKDQQFQKQKIDENNTTLPKKRLFHKKPSPSKNELDKKINNQLFTVTLKAEGGDHRPSRKSDSSFKKILNYLFISVFIIAFGILGFLLSRKRKSIRRYLHL